MTKYFGIILVALLSVTQAFAEIPATDFEKAMDSFLKTDKGQEKIGLATQSYFKKLQENMMKAQQESADKEREEQFKNPMKIDIGSSPVKGPANAKVTIVEFSDFECPYCSKGKNTMDEVLKAYPNDVKLVFKNLPLPFHKNAVSAAKAALAAGKQNKFWEMHDLLFTAQTSLGDAKYTEFATKLGLNLEKFKADMASKEIEAQVNADKELAGKLGFQGTPGFAVNGVAVKGAYPFEEFKKIIDRWLATK